MRASGTIRSLQALKPTANLTDRVTELLGEEILSGKYDIGQLLPSEQEMATLFGVSRTVVREAVSRLKAQGLLTARQGLGVLVLTNKLPNVFEFKAFDSQKISQIMSFLELRAGIEMEAAGLAALRRTDDQLERMSNALIEIEKATESDPDPDAGIDADISFHQAICAATANPFFVSFSEFLNKVLRDNVGTKRHDLDAVGGRTRAVKVEHLAIFEAINRGDPKGARQAARDHVDSITKRMNGQARKAGHA